MGGCFLIDGCEPGGGWTKGLTGAGGLQVQVHCRLLSVNEEGCETSMMLLEEYRPAIAALKNKLEEMRGSL